MRKALIVGIDNYPSCPLSGCVNDATEMKSVLERNSDGSPNFSVKLMTSNDHGYPLKPETGNRVFVRW